MGELVDGHPALAVHEHGRGTRTLGFDHPIGELHRVSQPRRTPGGVVAGQEAEDHAGSDGRPSAGIPLAEHRVDRVAGAVEPGDGTVGPGMRPSVMIRGPLLVSKVVPTRAMAWSRPSGSNGCISGLGSRWSAAGGPWKAVSTAFVPRWKSSSLPSSAMALKRATVDRSVEAKSGSSGPADPAWQDRRQSGAHPIVESGSQSLHPLTGDDVIGDRPRRRHGVAPAEPLGRALVVDHEQNPVHVLVTHEDVMGPTA